MARTLWLSEDTLLNTSSESTVEQRVKHGVGGDLVVGLDVLLQGGTAGNCQHKVMVNTRRVKFRRQTRDAEAAYLDPLR